MFLLFERSSNRFQSDCNILALAWMPYYNETKFRKALFDHHQRQLMNLAVSNPSPFNGLQNHASIDRRAFVARNPDGLSRSVAPNNQNDNQQSGRQQSAPPYEFVNSRFREFYERYRSLHESRARVIVNQDHAITHHHLDSSQMLELDAKYGRMPEFGWLAIGNIGKIVGVTLTSVVAPPHEYTSINDDSSQDLMQFNDDDTNNEPSNGYDGPARDKNINNISPTKRSSLDRNYDQMRPDRRCVRNNYNLRGHLDEVILVKWNDLYQKLATVDGKGNVLIWCKVNEKFTIQTPFYNRAKSVADFQWSNDGKTALICYTDSFILVGSSTGQRHWHSMLNLDDYHITCASWAPNDEQLYLGVSNGNIVVIHLPHSELTEMVVSYTNIRAMSWSSSIRKSAGQDLEVTGERTSIIEDRSNVCVNNEPIRRNSTIVNQRRLSLDYSVFLRHRFSSQSQATRGNSTANNETAMANEETHQSTASSRWNSSKNDDLGNNILALDFSNNTIQLFNSGLDDPKPVTIFVNLESYIMQWSSDGRILAVAGFNIHTAAPSVGCIRCSYSNVLKFYDCKGRLIHERNLKFSRYPITAFTWAHGDCRLFVATGPKLHCAKVFFGIPKLTLLTMACLQNYTKSATKSDTWSSVSQGLYSLNTLYWQSSNCPHDIHKIFKNFRRLESSESDYSLSGKDEKTLVGPKYDSNSFKAKGKPIFHYNSNIYVHNLPQRLRIETDRLCSNTIRYPFDDCWRPSDIIWHVPKNNQRQYCTLVCYTSDRKVGQSASYHYRSDWSDRLDDNHTTDQYKIFVLYIEFQGFFIPILRARRVGFLKPEFVIFDPDHNEPVSAAKRHCKVADMSSMNNYFNKQLTNAYSRIGRYDDTSSYPKMGLDDEQSHHIMYNCDNLHFNDSKGPKILHTRRSNGADDQYHELTGRNSSCLNSPMVDTRRNDQANALLIDHRSHHQEPIALPPSMDSSFLYKVNMFPKFSRNSSLKFLADNHSAQIQQSPSKTKSNFSSRSFRQKINKFNDQNFVLLERNELVRIKSNIWGTKFKLLNEPNQMIGTRSVLATVVYKASILHLQPRQIFLEMKDMSNYCCLCSKHHHSKTNDLASSKQSARRLDGVINSLLIGNDDKSSFATPKPTKGSQGEKQSKTRSAARGKDDRVVVVVGDNIRIAPSLEPNQRYRMVGELDQTRHSKDVREGFRRGKSDLGTTFATRNDSDESSGNSRRKRGQQRALERRHTDRLNSGHSRSKLDDHMKQSPVIVPLVPTRISSSSNLSDRKDDIITISLSQGDQVKVQMSAYHSLDSLGNSSGSTSRKTQIDEALAADKTLKSIQAITKMIVDLSHKSKQDSLFTGLNQSNSASTTNQLDLDTSTPSEPMTSAQFVPPDPPKHRPKRVKPRANERTELLNPRRPQRAQSVSSCPLKSIADFDRASSFRQPCRRSRDRTVRRATKLPEPPPAMSLSRRLSSSAKRLFDGSIRSIHSIGRYSASSDVESEENEPLVGEPIRLQRSNPIQVSSKSSKHLSQPNSPTRDRRSSTPARDLIAQKLRDHFRPRGMESLRTESFNQRRSAKKSTNRALSLSREYQNSQSSSRQSKFHAQNSMASETMSDEDSLEFTWSSDELEREMSQSDTDDENVARLGSRREAKCHANSRLKWLRRFSSSAELSSRANTDRQIRSKNQLSDAQSPRRRSKSSYRRKSICGRSKCSCTKQLRLKNRPPLWNELSQVYQLDFGGRVTQESAKNLQIDYEGNLVSTLLATHIFAQNC